MPGCWATLGPFCMALGATVRHVPHAAAGAEAPITA